MYDDEESGGRKKNDRLTITCKDKKEKKVWTATRGRSMRVVRPMMAAELVTKEWAEDGRPMGIIIIIMATIVAEQNELLIPRFMPEIANTECPCQEA